METNTLQTLLLETLTELKAGTEKAGTFVADQAPDVIQQLLAYQFWSAIFFGVMLLALGIILGWLTVKIFRQFDDGSEALALLPAVFCIFCIGGAIAMSDRALKIKIAPKVYVIEYTASLLKGK